MTDLFTADFFSANRDKLVEATNSKLIVLAANGLLQRSADTTYAFRQDSNFWYFTGANEPDYVLVISEEETYLIEPKRSEIRDQWDGAIDKQAIIHNSGITNVYEYHEGWNKLDKEIRSVKKIHTIAPAEPYFEHFGFYSNPARAHLLNLLGKHRKAQIVDIRKNIARLRQVKQTVEIKAIQLAIDTTSEALLKIKKNINRYKSEHQIVADITRDFIRSGATGHAYQPIVAYAKNAATIHYVDVHGQIGNDGLILMDVGAEVDNYSADITRTYAVKTPSKREVEVFNSVLKVKKYAESLLKPGVKMREFEKSVDSFMGKELKKLKLINDETDKKGIKKYYPHLVSHFLGLDTHDSADYDLPLEPGMVLTVEPGIYIPEESIGIRIEDDILITEKGIKNLSINLPIDLS